jgi:hypothetical protein
MAQVTRRIARLVQQVTGRRRVCGEPRAGSRSNHGSGVFCRLFSRRIPVYLLVPGGTAGVSAIRLQNPVRRRGRHQRSACNHHSRCQQDIHLRSLLGEPFRPPTAFICMTTSSVNCELSRHQALRTTHTMSATRSNVPRMPPPMYMRISAGCYEQTWKHERRCPSGRYRTEGARRGSSRGLDRHSKSQPYAVHLAVIGQWDA